MDLAIYNVLMPHQTLSRPLNHIATALAIGLLLFSWFACYLWIMMLTEGWGAPWDTTSIRPPIGHWQRSINDFFEAGIGVYLPTAIFLGASALMYGRTLLQTRDLLMTSLVYGFSNLAALLALLALILPIQLFLMPTPAYLTPADWSYWGDFRREWPLTLLAFVLFAGLIVAQPILVRRLRRDSG